MSMDFVIEELTEIQKTLADICNRHFNLLAKVTAKLVELQMKRLQETI